MTPLLTVLILAASTVAPPSAFFAPALCSGAPTPVAMAQPSLGGGFHVASTCTADCGSFPDVSCSGDSCSAVNQSCPGEQGHVTCGSNTYYCPSCGTPECTEGSFKTVTVGPTCGCEDGMSTPKDRYQCVNGQWEYQYSFCGSPFCQG
jgi:hypothetical protein